MIAQKRKIIVLIVILGVLVLSFIFGTIFNKERQYENIYEVNLLYGIELGDIYSIQLSENERQIKIEKESDTWFIHIENKKFPASEQKVNNFLENLLTVGTKRFVTGNTDMYDELYLRQGAKHITLYDEGDETIEKVVLGVDQELQTEYIKTSVSDKVFVSDSELAFYVRQDSAYWSKLTLFPQELKKAEIMKVKITARDLPLGPEKGSLADDYTLIKTKSKNEETMWTLVGDESALVNQSEVTSVVNTFTALRAERFVSMKDAVSESGTRPAFAEIITGDNKVYSLTVMKTDEDGKYICTTGENEYFYMLQLWQIERIFKPLQSLLVF